MNKIIITNYGLFPNSLDCRKSLEERKYKRNQKEIDACKKWINLFMERTANIQSKNAGSSFEYKHIVGNDVDFYISNPSFITASLELGFIIKSIRKNNPYAYFNMKFKKKYIVNDGYGLAYIGSTFDIDKIEDQEYVNMKEHFGPLIYERIDKSKKWKNDIINLRKSL